MRLITFVLLLSALAAAFPSPLSAAIVQTGSVSPHVNAWTTSTEGAIGDNGDGSVIVNAESLLVSKFAILGELRLNGNGHGNRGGFQMDC